MPHITTDRLTEKWQEVKESHNEIFKPKEELVVLDLLYESLPPTESKILVFVEKEGPVTSRQVADHFGLVINRVGNVLANLRRWGLVESEARTGPDGLYYEWRARE